MDGIDLHNTPAVPAPPGFTNNLENPEYRNLAPTIIIACVSTFFATLLLGIRVYTKAFLAKLFGWDDAMLIIAWLFCIAVQTIITCKPGCIWTEVPRSTLTFIGGAVQKMYGIHMWDLSIADARVAVMVSKRPVSSGDVPGN